MSTRPVRRGGLLLAAFLPLAACSGAQNALPPAGALSRYARHGSWMTPNLKGVALLYVTNNDGLVNVYDYPKHALVGILTSFTTPMGECIDRSGNIYITDYQKKTIEEYAHGGSTAIHVIKEKYQPYGCAIDPKTGNLAVANYGQTYGINTPDYEGDGNLAVYPHARGTPTYYGTSTQHFTTCSYDRYGDLLAAFQDGYSGYYETSFGYLRVHTKKLATILLNGPQSNYEWGKVSAIAWDGNYWDVDDLLVYRYTINIKPQLKDVITLSNAGDLGPIALYRSTLKAKPTQIAGTTDVDLQSDNGYLTIWRYPSGGTPIYQTSSYLDTPYGVAVSPAS
ncbi:MAG TPA: hypothetical protein VIX83_10590 [Candidatus Cybelea sp.]